MDFKLSQLVRLKVNPKLPFVVIMRTLDYFAADSAPRVCYLIRHQLDNGHATEFPVSEHEIEPAESLDPLKPMTLPLPETINLEDGRTATVQATIPDVRTHENRKQLAREQASAQVERIRRDIARAKNAPEVLPDILADMDNRRTRDDATLAADAMDAAQILLAPDAEFAGPLTVLPLEWIDNTTESETTPTATYQVDHGPNGWTAYYFSEPKDSTPDLESDHPYPTREEAKAWCERHASGEELEPRRCERCKMPLDANEHPPLCLACFNAPAQSVGVPMGCLEPPL